MTTLSLKKPVSLETRAKLAILSQSKAPQSDETPSPPLSEGVSQDPVKIARTPEQVQADEQEARHQARCNFEQARTWLQTAFPNAFNPKEPVPLKVNIHKDVQDLKAPVSARQLQKALKWHTGSPAYLEAVVNGQDRYDLNAHPVEPVSSQHKEWARQQIGVRKQTRKQKDQSKVKTDDLKDQ